MVDDDLGGDRRHFIEGSDIDLIVTLVCDHLIDIKTQRGINGDGFDSRVDDLGQHRGIFDFESILEEWVVYPCTA